MKSLLLACAFLGMLAASALSLTSTSPSPSEPLVAAAPALRTAAPAAPALVTPALVTRAQSGFGTRTQCNVLRPPTDPGVASIWKVEFDGVYWFEAVDEAGHRFLIHMLATGTGAAPCKGVVDFGDGQGGRYCKFTQP